MKVTFKGVPGEQHETVHMYGQNFKVGEAVEVTDPVAQRKLAAHPHFEADGEAAPVDDSTLRTYVSTVMTAGQQALQRAATDQGKQAERDEPPAPPAVATPQPMKSALEYQERESSGLPPPPPPKTAEELRAELEQAEKAEKESADGNAGTAGAKDSAEGKAPGSAGTSGSGRASKGR